MVVIIGMLNIRRMVERKYRNVLVCYDDFKCVGWRTPEEFKELKKENKVNWYAIKTGKELIKVDIKGGDD